MEKQKLEATARLIITKIAQNPILVLGMLSKNPLKMIESVKKDIDRLGVDTAFDLRTTIGCDEATEDDARVVIEIIKDHFAEEWSQIEKKAVA